MNAHHLQALVADRQAELHRDAAIRRATHDVASRGEIRRRVGMLLVEAGLHLITRSQRDDRVVVSARIAH
jgi:hypothetical protein